MSLPHVTLAQTDFSAGQIDSDAKRGDDPIVHAGARQMSNWRILNSRRAKNRPGRVAVYPQAPAGGRIDQVRIANNVIVDLCFQSDGSLVIRNVDGSVIVSSPVSYNWRAGTVDKIVWAVVSVTSLVRDIVICFPGMQPKIARYTPGLPWAFIDFTFLANSSGGLRAPFYRLANPGITLQPQAVIGTISLVASQATFQPGMVGTYIKWLDSQILLSGYVDSTHMVGVVQTQLPSSKNVTTASGNISGFFSPGDIVQGSSSGYQAEVVAWNSGTGVLTVNMLKSGQLFNGINGSGGPVEGDKIVGPNGLMVPTNTNPLTLTAISPQPSLFWTELIIGEYRGWPQSCFFDQGRFGFTDIPALPRAILWTGVNQFYDFQVGASPTDPIFELMSDSVEIYHVTAIDGGELIMTDLGVSFIPISETNPLKPGSVVFKPVTPEAASSVKPVKVAEGVLYVNAGRNRIILVAGTGASSSVRPYTTRDITVFHTALFSNIKALAATTGDGSFPERYIYALDSLGNLNVGRFDLSKDWIGWLPWSGSGTVNWISSLQSQLTFTTTYTIGAAPTVTLSERLEDRVFVDSYMPVNSVPVGLATPGGKGPLWYLPNGTVTLMDQGPRVLGTYQIDGNGFIIPQFTGGEDLASATLVAGQPWSATFEPFIPQNPSGQTAGQRMKRRKIARYSISVQFSTGFVIGDTRIPAYRMGEDATLPPPLREETVTGRQQGRDFDPRLVLSKDTPGSITLIEASVEVTV